MIPPKLEAVINDLVETKGLQDVRAPQEYIRLVEEMKALEKEYLKVVDPIFEEFKDMCIPDKASSTLYSQCLPTLTSGSICHLLGHRLSSPPGLTRIKGKLFFPQSDTTKRNNSSSKNIAPIEQYGIFTVVEGKEGSGAGISLPEYPIYEVRAEGEVRAVFYGYYNPEDWMESTTPNFTVRYLRDTDEVFYDLILSPPQGTVHYRENRMLNPPPMVYRNMIRVAHRTDPSLQTKYLYTSSALTPDQLEVFHSPKNSEERVHWLAQTCISFNGKYWYKESGHAYDNGVVYSPGVEMYVGGLDQEFKKHGKGKMTVLGENDKPTGWLEGEFKYDRFLQGKINNSDGSGYQGSVDEQGKFHGKGVFTLPLGKIIQADFVHGKALYGKIKLPFSKAIENYGLDRDTILSQLKFLGMAEGKIPEYSFEYEGQLEPTGFSITGFGRMTDMKGDVVVGQFVNGNTVGVVKVYGTDGSGYEAEFIKGRAEGTGKSWTSNGDWYEGEFKAGIKHGKGKASITGKIIEGSWENDVLVQSSSLSTETLKKSQDETEKGKIDRFCNLDGLSSEVGFSQNLLSLKRVLAASITLTTTRRRPFYPLLSVPTPRTNLSYKISLKRCQLQNISQQIFPIPLFLLKNICKLTK